MLLASLEGRTDQVLATDDGDLAIPWDDFHGAAYIADIFARVGARERALRWLGRSVDIGHYQPEFMMHYDASLENVRDDPEFRAIVERARQGAVRTRALIDGKLAKID